jgi:hypothetical protein
VIKIENTEVVGWRAAIRGMRNPMNSWHLSDTLFISSRYCDEMEDVELADICGGKAPIIKTNDLDLMKRLRDAGTDHRKYLRMIVVYADVTSSLYHFKELDTYKVGTVCNSCSTMHKIHAKEFTADDFAHNKLNKAEMDILETMISILNWNREKFLETKDKMYWWHMIQLLPSSYLQRRTYMFNYEVLANIYRSRKNHKLDEWHEFCRWIESLPYSELITGDR